MEKPRTIRQLIDLWPTRKALADDVTLGDDVISVDRVHGWAKAGSIPARYHRRVVDAGVARGFAVSADLLADLHHDHGRAA